MPPYDYSLEVSVVEIERDEDGYGFSIHGGSDIGSALQVMKISPGKAADRDGRLKVNNNKINLLLYISSTSLYLSVTSRMLNVYAMRETLYTLLGAKSIGK